MDAPSLFAAVLNSALADLAEKPIPAFTFAFYHDHESSAVSVCVDTEANSQKKVLATNRYNMKYFLRAIGEEDLADAELWQANIGRNLSLGDFALVNLARTDLIGDIEVDDRFYFEMVKALVEVHEEVARFAPARDRLIFCCSGPKDEVQYVWALPTI